MGWNRRRREPNGAARPGFEWHAHTASTETGTPHVTMWPLFTGASLFSAASSSSDASSSALRSASRLASASSSTWEPCGPAPTDFTSAPTSPPPTVARMCRSNRSLGLACLSSTIVRLARRSSSSAQLDQSACARRRPPCSCSRRAARRWDSQTSLEGRINKQRLEWQYSRRRVREPAGSPGRGKFTGL